MIEQVRHITLVLLGIVVVTQTLFVVRYYFSGGWQSDFVGQSLMFKSTAVLARGGVVELLLWLFVPDLINLIPTWLLVLVVFTDVFLAIGCTVQYLALERVKLEDRHDGTDLGRERATD